MILNTTKKLLLSQVIGQEGFGKTSAFGSLLSFHHFLLAPSTVGVPADIKDLQESSSIKPWKSKNEKKFPSSKNVGQDAVCKDQQTILSEMRQRFENEEIEEQYTSTTDSKIDEELFFVKKISLNTRTPTSDREIDEKPSHLPDAQRKQMWYSHLNAKLENSTYGKLPDEFAGEDVFNYFIKLHYLYILIHTLLKLLVETARPVPAIPPFTSDPFY